MDSFASVIEGWHDFYSVINAAAATLVGLLFVSLSMNVEIITHEGNADLRELALQTFVNFLNLVVVSVLFLIPLQDPLGLGLPLLGISLGGLIINLNLYLKTRRSQNHVWERRDITRRFSTPLLSYLVMVVVSVSLILGQTGGLYWLVPVMIVLIIGASVNSWDLLLRLIKPSQEG
jgi:modulator of FtsH protease